jgi:hypothetical protein
MRILTVLTILRFALKMRATKRSKEGTTPIAIPLIEQVRGTATIIIIREAMAMAMV